MQDGVYPGPVYLYTMSMFHITTIFPWFFEILLIKVDFFQANEEKREMDALQHSNKRILFNLLPAHVATHFLDNQFRSNMVTLSHK